MRNIGLDIGDKRIGVALSDPDEILASPLTTIDREEDERTINEILKLVNKHGVKRMVIGLPYSLNGSLSQQSVRTREFIEKIAKIVDIELIIQDERYSTVVAKRLIVESGVKKTKRKELLDAASAAYILQGYLDSREVTK